MLTYADFLAFFPEFCNGVSEVEFSANYRRARLQSCGFDRFCDVEVRQMALALLTAHLLLLGKRACQNGGMVGVKSVSSQDDSLTFITPDSLTDEASWYTLTPYGLELQMLINSSVGGMLI